MARPQTLSVAQKKALKAAKLAKHSDQKLAGAAKRKRNRRGKFWRSEWVGFLLNNHKFNLNVF
jgi:hypothetical protein